IDGKTGSRAAHPLGASGSDIAGARADTAHGRSQRRHRANDLRIGGVDYTVAADVGEHTGPGESHTAERQLAAARAYQAVEPHFGRARKDELERIGHRRSEPAAEGIARRQDDPTEYAHRARSIGVRLRGDARAQSGDVEPQERAASSVHARIVSIDVVGKAGPYSLPAVPSARLRAPYKGGACTLGWRSQRSRWRHWFPSLLRRKCAPGSAAITSSTGTGSSS